MKYLVKVFQNIEKLLLVIIIIILKLNNVWINCTTFLSENKYITYLLSYIIGKDWSSQKDKQIMKVLSL